MTPWYEDDEFWAELQPWLTSDVMIEAAVEDSKQAAALLRVDPPARLLDLGCGPGRHSVALARLGFRVTGVDRTTRYLNSARDRASTAAVDIEFVQASILEFRRSDAFDGAVSLLSSFGYFADRDDDLRVLQNIYASLKPGAAAAVDLMGKEIIGRIFQPTDWQELPNGRCWLQKREVLPGWEKMRIHWIFMGAGDRKEFTFEHRIYSGIELAEMMRRAGFSQAAIYGGLDGRPYDRAATRLVVVGTK